MSSVLKDVDLALEIVKATVTLFLRLLNNKISTHRLFRRLRHLVVTSDSKFAFQDLVDEILVEKQGCCSPQEGLVDHPDIRQVEV